MADTPERPPATPPLRLGEWHPEDQEEVLVYTRAAVREVDRRCTEEYRIPAIVLMENAAIHLSDVVLHLLEENSGTRALIFCGRGNNGGDGLALARHLHNAGASVRIVLSHPRGAYEGAAATHLEVAARMAIGMEVAEADQPGAAVERAIRELGGVDLVVDALLGTGAASPVREPVAMLIAQINELGRKGALVLAVDLPSGLDADTGEPLGVAVEADVTVTFVGMKAGFTSLSAQGYVGEIVVADIGAPRELALALGRPLLEQAPRARHAHEADEHAEVRPAGRLGPRR